MADKKFVPTHPFIIFWLGVLTGIVALALMSYYFSMGLSPEEYQSSSFRFFYPSYSVPTTSYGDPQFLNGADMIGDPTGSMVDPTRSIGDPTGS